MHWKARGWTLIGMLLLVIPGAMTLMKAAAAMQTASTEQLLRRRLQIRFSWAMGRRRREL